jgi:hypothetical protein
MSPNGKLKGNQDYSFLVLTSEARELTRKRLAKVDREAALIVEKLCVLPSSLPRNGAISWRRSPDVAGLSRAVYLAEMAYCS